MEGDYEGAVQTLLSAKRVTALTGAGVSAESGIPTFRGSGGLWENYPVEKVASVEGFYEDPELVWRFYEERKRNMRRARPNLAHRILAEMEKHFDMWVITQNIDGLHVEAGSKNVIEMHGNIWRVRCTSCSYSSYHRDSFSEIPPKCPKCGSLLRPDVVWFGEPIYHGDEIFRIAKTSDVFMVIGTSAQVHPAASLPFIAKDYGARVIEINLHSTPVSVIADYSLRGKATQVLDALFQRLQEAWRRG